VSEGAEPGHHKQSAVPWAAQQPHLGVWRDDGIQRLRQRLQHDVPISVAAVFGQGVKGQGVAPAAQLQAVVQVGGDGDGQAHLRVNRGGLVRANGGRGGE
jgi:hypothetical protein